MNSGDNLYRYAGLVVLSDVALPLQPFTGLQEPHWRVGLVPQPPVTGEVIRRYQAVEGQNWLVLKRTGNGGIAYCFPDLATFVVESSRLIKVHPEPRVQDHTLAHLLLEQVLPLQFVTEGRHVLHASAIAVDVAGSQSAVLFMGTSGAGKSSTALACSLAGATLLGDDFALLSGDGPRHQVVSVDLGLRLWEDVTQVAARADQATPVAEYTVKLRVPSPSKPPEASVVDVGALVCLGPRTDAGSEVSLRPMGPAAAAVEVAQNTYRVEMTDPLANQQLLDQAAALVQDVPVFRVAMPADLGQLARHGATLLDLLKAAMSAPRAPSPAGP